MSARERAERIHALLRHRDHAEQAIAILESLDDDETKRTFVRGLRVHAPMGERWRAEDHVVRAAILCAKALPEIERELARVSLTHGQLAMPGVGALLAATRDLAVHGGAADLLPTAVLRLPVMPHAERVSLFGGTFDLSALVRSADLTHLSLLGGELCDTNLPLHPRASLQQLQLHIAPRLTSLRGLERHGRLRELEITGAPLGDLEPLAALHGLVAIDLRDCSFDSLAPLRMLREVRVLALAGTDTTPDDLPSNLRPYATWTPEPPLKRLAQRPVHPDATVV